MSDFDGESAKTGGSPGSAAPKLGLQVRALSPDEMQEHHLDRGVVVEAVEDAQQRRARAASGRYHPELEKARITSPNELAA